MRLLTRNVFLGAGGTGAPAVALMSNLGPRWMRGVTLPCIMQHPVKCFIIQTLQKPIILAFCSDN